MPPKHKKWNPSDMIKAVKAVQNKEMGSLNSTKLFGVTKSSKSGRDSEELVNIPIDRKPILLNLNISWCFINERTVIWISST